MKDIKCVIFDLDGVIVDTAKYHYLAWKRLAEGFLINFTEKENENFKGVSRMACMEQIVEMGQLKMNDDMKVLLANTKNEWYVKYIEDMPKDEMFDNVKELIITLREKGIKIALGSASKNAGLILDKLEIRDLFDVIVDGTKVTKAKPDPEVFLTGAKALNVAPENCLVVEDAAAGLEAAKAGNMYSVGIGDFEGFKFADKVYAKAEDMIDILNYI